MQAHVSPSLGARGHFDCPAAGEKSLTRWHFGTIGWYSVGAMH